MTHLILLLALMQQPDTRYWDYKFLPEGCYLQVTGEVVCDKKPEPIDVPATDWPRLIRRAGDYWECGLNACFTDSDIYEMKPGCDDKTRILMHDEQDPPKWYCHKPQTAGAEVPR